MSCVDGSRQGDGSVRLARITVMQEECVVMGRRVQMWEEDNMSELALLLAVKSLFGLLESDYY